MTTKTSKLDYVPSHNMTGDYAVLMETSGEEMESWYYFIKVEGNEENLNYLQKQLEDVEWYILGDMSTFDLDLDHYVSAHTAKEMTKLEMYHCSFHRKFDGKLQKIDLGFGKKDKNKKKIRKTFEVLGYGLIENFIDDEDLDPEDLVTDSDESEDTDYESVSSSESDDSRDRRRRKKYDSGDSDDDRRARKNDIPPAVRLRESLRASADERRKGTKKEKNIEG